MAPAEYFRLPRRTFRNPGPNNVFARFHDALESLKERLPELGCISFNPHAVVLEELDPEEFVTMFDEKRIQMLLDTRLAARRPTAVLRPNADGVIKDVVQKALADAHMG
jgi:hypothetical protein